MSNLDRILDEAMTLPANQQEMLLQILQRRIVERRRDEIAQDTIESLAEFRSGKLKALTAPEAIAELRAFLQEDESDVCQDGTQITISADGEPVLKRIAAAPPPSGAAELEAVIRQRLPERSVLDLLCHVEHWLNWVRHFEPVSGSEPKIENSAERYILAVFGSGCNLGPNQNQAFRELGRVVRTIEAVWRFCHRSAKHSCSIGGRNSSPDQS